MATVRRRLLMVTAVAPSLSRSMRSASALLSASPGVAKKKRGPFRFMRASTCHGLLGSRRAMYVTRGHSARRFAAFESGLLLVGFIGGGVRVMVALGWQLYKFSLE